MEIGVDGIRAADVTDVAVSEDEVREAVDALGVQKGNGDRFGGDFVAAIDKPVFGGMMGLQVSAVAFAERKDSEAGDGALMEP